MVSGNINTYDVSSVFVPCTVDDSLNWYHLLVYDKPGVCNSDTNFVPIIAVM
jgi:hypothetical protein